jgi:hypothetical protein
MGRFDGIVYCSNLLKSDDATGCAVYFELETKKILARK